MKQIYVKDIREGDGVNGAFLIDSAHLRFTKNNKAYLKLVLADNSGQIESVMWDETIEKNPGSRDIKAGDFVDVGGQAAVNRYTNKVEVVLNRLHRLTPTDLDVLDFLPKTDRDIEELKAQLAGLVDQVDDKHINKLLRRIFDDPQLGPAFYTAPAAKNYHHAYLGGLLEHSVSVGYLAAFMCDHYGGLNKSLLIAGAILHDIGKIREFNYAARIDYSTEGRLKGHIVIGDAIVAGVADLIKGFPHDMKIHLSHLILSHQGEPEYGAAVKPKTKEAIILNIIDNADAKVNGWLGIAKKYGDHVEWTDFQSMFGDFLYLGSSGNEAGAAAKSASNKPEGTLF